jgi:hypothetical protein
MGWFGSNRNVVTWLAFFALACQLLLSFGHLHVGKFSGGSAEWAAAQTGDASANASPLLPRKNPTGLAGDFCAICASINLVGTLVLPIFAIVLILGLFTEILHRSLAVSEPVSFDHLPFSARGPPHA